MNLNSSAGRRILDIHVLVANLSEFSQMRGRQIHHISIQLDDVVEPPARGAYFLEMKHVAVVGQEFREDPVDTWLHEEGHRLNVVLTVPHYLQALHVVAQSDLVAVIPERLIRAYSAILGLDVLPVPLDAGTFDEYLLHPPTKHFDPGCVWLRGVLHGVAKSLKPLASERIRKEANLRRGISAL